MKFIPALMVSALSFCTLQAEAQTMKVYTGSVVTAVPAAAAGDIIFNQNPAVQSFSDQPAGTGSDLPFESPCTFSVMGNEFYVSDVDQILVDRTDFPAKSVQVNYSGNRAEVMVSADVAPYLDITVSDAHVRVMAAPTLFQEISYTLKGASENGSFYMDSEYKSSLTLENLTLTNPDSAAVNIACGKRIAVNLPEGTTSTLADARSKLHKACFFINGHAEFSGNGTLNLSGNSRHAYASDEYTWFKPGFGTLNVTAAAGDGLHIEQYFRIQDGTLNISGTKGDCIDVQAKIKRQLPENGQIFINGGTLNLQVKTDDTKGLKCDSIMTIAGGNITADVSGNGSKGISAGTDLNLNNYLGTAPQIKMDVTGGTYMPGNVLLEAKCRGIKVKRDFTFDGGDINMTVSPSAKGISVDGKVNYLNGTTNVFW